MTTTILLVDDHPLFRKGLRLLLEDQEDFQNVGEAGDGREAIDRVRALSPDVVIMDISMPDFNGIDATRGIISEVPSAKVVALSMHAGKRFVEERQPRAVEEFARFRPPVRRTSSGVGEVPQAPHINVPVIGLRIGGIFREITVIIIGIRGDRHVHLLHPVGAVDAPRTFDGILQCRQEHPGQSADNRDHDQEFHQRETTFS